MSHNNKKPTKMGAVPGARSLMLLAAVILLSGVSFAQEPREKAPMQLEKLRVPNGFEISLAAEGVDNARGMARSPEGTLFVGTRTLGSVYALRDRDGDGNYEEQTTIANELKMPSGVAFHEGDLYVAEIDKVWRYEEIEAKLGSGSSLEPVDLGVDLPDKRHHGWKFIRFGPDGLLYVPVGAPCNVCADGDPYATILRMTKDGGDVEVYARGVRNTVGFDWHPETGELWFTDNGRDMLGDDIPPDELNRILGPGQHFGFPYCHGEDLADPVFGEGRSCSHYTPPAKALDPHVAAIGMRFYTGDQFPAEYRNQIFIAEHGSWNRRTKIGYRVMVVTLGPDGEVESYEPFVDGWLSLVPLPGNRLDQKSWGRPADVLVEPDGSLLISDDQQGAIYRVRYSGGGADASAGHSRPSLEDWR